MKSLMPNFSFRFKLLLGMMLVVVGATGTTLYVSQKRMETAYQSLFAERFTGQIAVFNSMQDARLSAIKTKCNELTSSVRVQAALEAAKESGDSERLYQNTFIDVRELAVQAIRQRRPMALALVRYTDEKGKEIPPPAPLLEGRGLLVTDQLKSQLEQVTTNLTTGPVQQVGYVSIENTDPDQPRFPARARQLAAHQKKRTLVEVILTRIEDLDGKCIGSLIVGFHFINDTERGLSDFSRIKSGIWSDSMLYTESLAPADAVEINSRMREMMEQKRAIKMQGTFDVDVGGEPHQVFFQLMNRDSNFTPTYQVSIYSMAEAIRDQQDLQRNIIMFGAILLMGSMLISVFLSNGFSAPIRELVAATGCVQDGDFKVRVPVRSNDEVGQLAQSFNEMTAELAVKEKYRAVLDMVADKDVAHQMVHGQMALGGEKREVSVIFCDIRGFTAHTQGMDPAEVIKMLNEHMTALTKVVYEQNGVVDKFVGDLIMAVFGAPKSYGDDAFNATRCALRMIEERNKLNQISAHKIEVGIGIATGEVVAGCMGSADRQNYTVLGERVNLASRLCSVAARGEVVIDETTRARLSGRVDAEELPELKLKGFSDMVRAYKVTSVQPKK